MSIILDTYRAKEVREGAGVIVNRVFGYYEVPKFDPFLMLDYFVQEGASDSPGFPWHPHKGIETITYFLRGAGQHEDSLGNKGTIAAGELQWMSAGKGIMHQEMPVKSEDGYQGFQFWVNLPASKKLKEPEYQYIKAGTMQDYTFDGGEVKVIAGRYKDVNGPIDKSDLGIQMYHVTLEPGQNVELNRTEGRNGYAFVFEGDGTFGSDLVEAVTAYTLDSGTFSVTAGNEGLQMIFAEGKPLDEPIAWHGPVVMNTREELVQTFKDIEDGTFVQWREKE